MTFNSLCDKSALSKKTRDEQKPFEELYSKNICFNI